ncbi:MULTISPECIES: lytic polysaccharide monooxygenase [unclassified Agarivorans]|uniref:lytic polysaccharide monooxygenase n=1 Tax=unclassified Agarivorans TaxID=2636026 RepID=UPI0026E43AB6|nr:MULTISPECIES: lytic polysaccharide monooxygenase [unclassified Agarivorans]MDO6683914.1 lytic polysaccharide monooxygenase [Agarivorans sp. 3_MG-2023]MDO6714353.1 lytic polysaccharide monooxygenase [Agarivorans sp. 2_MG-2023]
MTNKLILSLCILGSSQAFAHGLIVDPPSRNALCGLTEKPDQATSQHCIDAFANDAQGGYKFMSVLTHAEGRAVVSPLPANVCGFDSETWEGGATPWDAATSWPGQPAQAGPLDITWNISWGNHFSDTREFHYWITKPGFVFDPSKALSWDDFETEPFCVLPYDDNNPNANPAVVSDKEAVTFTTTCTLPERSGHQVVYGEWGRNSWTFERFHGCIDLAYAEDTLGKPIADSQTLATNQDTPLSITLSGSDSNGQIASYQVLSQPANGTLSGTGAALTYTPAAEFVGDDDFSFSVTDNEDLESAPAQISISVKSTANTAPVASFEASSKGLVASFDASASSDPENDALTYQWDFGDGYKASGALASHTYDAAGSYSVLLSVSDGLLETTSSQELVLSALPPTQAGCEYVVVDQWGSGFNAEIRLINTGEQAINGWQVSWAYADGSSVNQLWNGVLSGNGPYTVSNTTWNGTIEPGQTISVGFQGTSNGNLEVPIVSGDICQ